MSKSKDKKKAAQLVLRVEKSERDAFVALCETLDTTAAREIRRFMREMVASHAAPEPEAEPSEGKKPAAAEVAEEVLVAEAPADVETKVPAETESKPAAKRRKKPAA